MGSGGGRTIYNMRSYNGIVAYFIEVEAILRQKPYVSTRIQ